MYGETPNAIVSEIVNLRSVTWMPCAKRAKQFVCTLKSLKISENHLSNIFPLLNILSRATYVDDATLISNSLEADVSVLQQIDQKATDLNLFFKPSKCVFYLFDVHSHRKEGIPLFGSSNRRQNLGLRKIIDEVLLGLWQRRK